MLFVLLRSVLEGVFLGFRVVASMRRCVFVAKALSARGGGGFRQAALRLMSRKFACRVEISATAAASELVCIETGVTPGRLVGFIFAGCSRYRLCTPARAELRPRSR